MKVVILAGGYGTRITEESYNKPKPMIEIGNKPIIWHIMKYYASFGYKDFVICCGYKAEIIQNYFKINKEDWNVESVDTGLDTMTGGRVKRIKEYVGDEMFFLTYGDGVSDVNINLLLKHHINSDNIVTLTAVHKPDRFGIIRLNNDKVVDFEEKSISWINGGWMICNKEIFNYIKNDSTIFERDPLEKLASENKLGAYMHEGFWQCMDTLREKNKLEKLIEENKAPWIVWK